MIRDKIIQKRIRGKVLAVAMTAFMASLFVPIVGKAADGIPDNVDFSAQWDQTAFQKAGTPVVVAAESSCKGHEIIANNITGDSGIVIQSGHHYIKLGGVTITSAESILQIQKGAEVTLVLEGNNNLTGGDAGIYVAQDATLNIMEGKEGATLKIKSDGDGAGIGGYGIGAEATAGNINIKSGTIIAQGGHRGAGIGASDSGSVQNITIDGGCVIAKGGDGVTGGWDEGSTLPIGAPGIGQGNAPKRASGTIVINGGSVTAIGGKNLNDTNHASGIVGESVTSYGGNAVIVSDGFGANTKTNNLNGLIWDLKRDENTGDLMIGSEKIDDSNFLTKVWDSSNKKSLVSHGNVCTVYGSVEMPPKFPEDFNDFDKVDGPKNQLKIPTGASFKIPAEGTGFDFYGLLLVEDNATIINPGQFHFKSGSDRKFLGAVKYQVSLLETDITINKPFTYKGEAYKTNTLDNEIFKIASHRQEDIGGTLTMCPIDTTGLKYVFEWAKNDTSIPKPDIDKDGVKNAGNYTVTFTYGTKEYTKEFTIEKLDITNNSNIVVSPIPDREYKDADFESRDFSEKEVVVTYAGDTMTLGKDYLLSVDAGQKNVTNSAKIGITGINNFKGSLQTTFKIVPIKMTDENIVVDLQGNWKVDSDGNMSTTYDGNQHKPAIKSVSVKIDETKAIELNDWEEGYEGSTPETIESNYYDAGTIKLTITSKDSNVEGKGTKEFTIKPLKVNAKSITPARTDRPYETNANIGISKIEVDLTGEEENKGLFVISRDGTAERPIELPTGVVGIIAENDEPLDIANVKPLDPATGTRGAYTQVYLPESVCLAGKGGRNYSIGDLYTLDDTKALFRLTDGVVITPSGAPGILVEGDPVEDEFSTEGNPKFNCNLKVTASSGYIDPTSTIYSYRCTTEGELPPEDFNQWDKTIYGESGIVTYPDITPDHVERFYVRIGETDNVAGTEVTGPWEVVIPLYTREDGPSGCTLTAEPFDEEGESIYKLIVEPHDYSNPSYPQGRYMYSLSEDGEYQYSNEFYGEPNSTYTAYVKFAEGGGYSASKNATPTDSVSTGEGKAKQPVIVCNETSPNEAGEINVTGTAMLKMEYNGRINGINIYYTLDGTEPTSGSQLYPGEAVPIDDKYFKDGRVTVKAKVIKPNVAQSDVTTVTVIKSDDPNNPDNPNNPNNPANDPNVTASAQPLTEETIANTKLQDMGLDGVKSGLASNLGGQGYTDNPQIKYFDLNVKVRDTADGPWRDATAEDFAKYGNEGMEVEVRVADLQQTGIDLPTNVSPTTHKFGMSHMFATDVGSNAAGTVESIPVSSGKNGTTISFRVRGASPFAIAYQSGGSTPEDPNGGNGEGPNGDNGEGPNGDNGENPNGNAQVNAYSIDNPNGNGTTTNTDAGTQGVSDDAANALSGIMPKTGDPLSFVPWIAAAVVSVGAVVYFATRKTGKKKKQTVKKTQAVKKKK